MRSLCGAFHRGAGLKPSSSKLAIPKPPSSQYTCYFENCWAPSCPTHGVANAQQDVHIRLSTSHSRFPTSPSTALPTHPDAIYLNPPTVPLNVGLTRSYTAPNGGFHCYATTCEATNCPRHQRSSAAILGSCPSRAHARAAHHPHPVVHITMPSLTPRLEDCPDLAYSHSPSSASSTDSIDLPTPTGMQMFPRAPTLIMPCSDDDEEAEEEDRFSFDSILSSALSAFPSPPSIMVEPPSARTSMQSKRTTIGSDTDGYDAGSELDDGQTTRPSFLNPPKPFNKHKGSAVHRLKGKENFAPTKDVRQAITIKELARGRQMSRGLLI